MIKIVHKNLFDSECKIIAHQVNTEGVMAKGVSKIIKDKYKHVYSKYHSICQKYSSDKLLGKIQTIPCNPENKEGQYIANLFAQTFNSLDENGRKTDYNALRSCFRKLSRLNEPLAIPYNLGCSMGRANWDTILKIIKEECRNIDVEICTINNDIPLMTWFPGIK